MPTVPEELDVFHVPHSQMKKIVHNIEDQLSRTDFHNAEEYVYLLQTLTRTFKDLQSHEEIENNYILSPLLPRLTESKKATLEHDIHSSDRLQWLMCLVESAPHSMDDLQRIEYGETLKSSVISFTNEVIPHMEEEEEVFQPLLIEFYTESELRELRNTVLKLHKQRLSEEVSNATSSSQSPSSLVSLPQEILLKVLSYLEPQDLCRVSQVHPVLNELAFDGSLWRSLHPVRWADSHWRFHSTALCLDKNDEKISHESVVTNDATKFLLSCGNSVNASLCQKYNGEEDGDCYFDDDEDNPRLMRECNIMRGLIDYVLPKVGPNVEVLDLAYGKSLTGEMIYKMLSFCPNLHYLDLSHTQATDYSFRGLVDPGGSRYLLKYVDLTGCSQITDTTLLRIAWATTPPKPMPTLSACSNCSCDIGRMFDVSKGGGGGRDVAETEDECELKFLILSGCHQITDVGLRSLAIGHGLPNLRYLNLTGVPGISSVGLNKLVVASPRLEPHLLFYCDNIADGPHPLNCNGCCNVLGSYQCCQNMYKS